MLEIKNLKISYNRKFVFENLNFTVNSGEILVIMGLNGSGKTTLLKCIAQLLKYDGFVYINGKNLKAFDLKELSKCISYLPQKNKGENFTVFDAILLGRKPYINFIPSENDIKIVKEIIKFLHLEEIKDKSCEKISGGEFQKVLIGRALAQQPEVLLLDEPINHLDLYNQIEVMKIIKKITKEFKVITILVLHDINIAMKFGKKFLFLKNGKIFKYGEKSIIDNKLLKEVFMVNAIIENNTVIIDEN